MFHMKDFVTKVEDWMVAVTFAEAGEHETALEFVRSKSRKSKKKRIDKKPVNRVDNRPTLQS